MGPCFLFPMLSLYSMLKSWFLRFVVSVMFYVGLPKTVTKRIYFHYGNFQYKIVIYKHRKEGSDMNMLEIFQVVNKK